MRKLRELLDRASDIAHQFYSARELRALGLFLALGIAVLAYRGGKRTYYDWYPAARDSVQTAHTAQQDSIFHDLSQKAIRRDSLFFALPEDSLLPPSVRARMYSHSKEADLRLGSIALNTATKDDLIKLPGVGPTMASRILDYRAERGRFRSIDELENISGFGPKRIERTRRFLRLD